jgi:hypothetical protein
MALTESRDIDPSVIAPHCEGSLPTKINPQAFTIQFVATAGYELNLRLMKEKDNSLRN